MPLPSGIDSRGAGWLGLEEINVIHIYRLRLKNGVTASFDSEKVSDKTQHPFLIKRSRDWEERGTSSLEKHHLPKH